MADKMAELSNKVSKAPFPCLPYRGYNVLGACFDLEVDNYSGWCVWPGGPERAFETHQLPGIKKGLRTVIAVFASVFLVGIAFFPGQRVHRDEAEAGPGAPQHQLSVVG